MIVLAAQVHPLLDWGVGILRWFNDVPSWLGPAFDAGSFIGSIEMLTVVAAVVLWSIDAALGWRVVLVLLVYGSLNTPMKVAFGLPRPYWVLHDITARAAETSYGMPSGHSGFAMAVVGRLAAGVGGTAAWVVGGATIALVATSRMYLGVHWPTDVLGGLLAGGAVLLVALRAEPRVTAWLRERPFGQQVGLALACSLALLVVVSVAAMATSGRDIPETWTRMAATATPDAEALDPRALDGPVGSAGALFGFAAGWLLLRRQGGYDAGGVTWQRLARLPIGLSGTALLFGGVTVEPSAGSSVAALALTWVQYVAAGAWMGWGAPSLFIWADLADRPSPNAPAERPEATSSGR